MILLSTLPIGASAALADGTVFVFSMDLGNDMVPGSPSNGPFSIGYASGYGSSLTMNLASSSTIYLGLSGYYAKTVKDKYLIYRSSPDGDYLLGLTPTVGQGAYIFFTAPADGFYNFDFQLINLSVSDNETITYAFFYKPAGLDPVCHIGHTYLDLENFDVSRSLGLYMKAGDFVWLEVNNNLLVSDPETTFPTVALMNFTAVYDSSGDSSDNVLYNDSYSIIYGSFPDGSIIEVARVYAPYHHIGSYSCDLSYLTSTLIIPTSYNGYGLDFESSPQTITVDPSSVRSYTLPYRDVSAEPELNTNYALINIYTGTTLHSTQKVYADQGTYGSWSKSIGQLNAQGYINLPSELNGYQIDMQQYYNTTITVDPDVVNTYSVYYDIEPEPEPVLNTNHALINIYTGTTLHSTQKVYADQGTYGSWSKPLGELNAQGYINLPSELNGYQIDMQDYYYTTITVDPNVVNTYNVYYDMQINSSYAIIYAETPAGRKEIGRIYPSEIEGETVIGSKTYLVQWLNNEGVIPSVVDGYSIATDLCPTSITIDPDKVNEYTLYYYDLAADKQVIIYYYDDQSKLIDQQTIYLSSSSYVVNVPQFAPYIAVPSKFDLIPGLMMESFNVYCFDFEAARQEAYQAGKSEGLQIAQDDLEAQLNAKYQEGYDQGFNEGYADGSTLTSDERAELRKDYNIFTGFFDGIFAGFLDSYNTVVKGVGFGGVTLETVISTVVIAIVVFFLIKVIR